MSRIEVWSCLVETPDSASATVSVHGSRLEACQMLAENYDLDKEFQETQGRPLPQVEGECEPWVHDLEKYFNFDIRLEPHDLYLVNVQVADR